MDAEKMAKTVQLTFSDIFSNLNVHLDQSEKVINRFEAM